MKFVYHVFDSTNKTKKGVVDASNLKEATKLLIDQGWYIKKIVPKGGFKTGFSELSFGGVSLMEKVLMVKHLGTMIKSGINLNEALEVIADQTVSKKFKKIINDVLDRIKSGQSLANSLARYPKIFDPLIINIIKVGEESGTLESNLEYLSGELEDRLELRRNIRAAAFYPAIVFSATLGLGLILAYFVLPKITQLFKTMDFDLPLQTKILLWVANIMDHYGLYIIAGVILGLVAFRILTKQDFFKPAWHWFLMKVPIVGSIFINYNLVLMNRTLGILLKSGLTIDQAVVITTDTTANFVYRKKLKEILPQIQTGKRLSDVMTEFKQSKRNPIFPLLVIKMIGVGERSGRLDESLTYLADYYEKEVDHTTKNLTTVLEPLLLIFVGLMVGFVAVSVISPIYQITGRFNQQ
ncbi:MAG: type II secretion system F family protein [Candidatus Buchananbacteria bacterium]